MATEITQFDYREAAVDTDPATAASMLQTMCESGVNLIGFTELPQTSGKSRLELVAEDTHELAIVAAAVRIPWSAKKTGFLIRGENLPRIVIPHVLQRLAEARIAIRAMRAVSTARGSFGAMLSVKAQDVPAAAKALLGIGRALHLDPVQEASEESFPASDAPAWAA
jgi:hypothetical protein